MSHSTYMKVLASENTEGNEWQQAMSTRASKTTTHVKHKMRSTPGSRGSAFKSHDHFSCSQLPEGPQLTSRRRRQRGRWEGYGVDGRMKHGRGAAIV